jgi:cytochrome c
MTGMERFAGVMVIICPPVGVLIRHGMGVRFLISAALTVAAVAVFMFVSGAVGLMLYLAASGLAVLWVPILGGISGRIISLGALMSCWIFAAYVLSLHDNASDFDIASHPDRALSGCTACHSLQAKSPPDAIAPSLAGVVGRAAGTLPGFEYSDALANAGFRWTEDRLVAFLIDPEGFVPGTAMVRSGNDEATAKQLVEALKELK